MSEEEEEREELLDLGTDDFQLPQNNQSHSKVRRRQFRWKLVHDLALTKEVENFLPFKQPHKKQCEMWTKVADALNETFNMTTLNRLSVNRRFDIILAFHKKNETKNRYKSGIEEEVGELQERLSNLLNMVEDKKSEEEQVIATKQKKVDQEKAKAEEIRGAACTTVKRNSSSEEIGDGKKMRQTEKNLLALWQEKQENDRKDKEAQLLMEVEEREKDRRLKERKFELLERQMDLEKSKFDHVKEKEHHEMKMKERELSLQEEERKSQIKLQETLLQLIAADKLK